MNVDLGLVYRIVDSFSRAGSFLLFAVFLTFLLGSMGGVALAAESDDDIDVVSLGDSKRRRRLLAQ